MSTTISILGNTGRDVELRYTPQGTPVANFSIASNTVRNTANGKQKKTDWYNVSAFGKQGETLARYVSKGDQILIRGKLTFNPWLDREGQPRVSADVILQDFEFAGGNSAKTVHEAAEEPIAEQANNQMASEENVIEAEIVVDTEERAEMLAAVHEMDAGDEAFAGQY